MHNIPTQFNTTVFSRKEIERYLQRAISNFINGNAIVTNHTNEDIEEAIQLTMNNIDSDYLHGEL